MGKWSFVIPLAIALMFIVNQMGFSIHIVTSVVFLYSLVWGFCKFLEIMIKGEKK